MLIAQTDFNQRDASRIAGERKESSGAVGTSNPQTLQHFNQKRSPHLAYTLGICKFFIGKDVG